MVAPELLVLLHRPPCLAALGGGRLERGEPALGLSGSGVPLGPPPVPRVGGGRARGPRGPVGGAALEPGGLRGRAHAAGPNPPQHDVRRVVGPRHYLEAPLGLGGARRRPLPCPGDVELGVPLVKAECDDVVCGRRSCAPDRWLRLELRGAASGASPPPVPAPPPAASGTTPTRWSPRPRRGSRAGRARSR